MRLISLLDFKDEREGAKNQLEVLKVTKNISPVSCDGIVFGGG